MAGFQYPVSTVQAGGRTLAYLEVGDPAGQLVLHNHGGPSSRLEAALFAAAATDHGLRFVCVDRPGIGLSDPQPDRTFRTWTEDLLAVADSLGAERFAVTGWSEGGPWALAAAAYLDPTRLAHVSYIAGAAYGAFGTNWADSHLSPVDALGGRLALRLPWCFKLMYGLLALSAKRFGPRYANMVTKAVGPADRLVLADEQVLKEFIDASRECFRQGSEGLVVDATLLYESWPFGVADISRPVHFWQGGADVMVPEVINRTVAEATPGAVWHPVRGGGHFIAVSRCAEILAVVADELRQQPA